MDSGMWSSGERRLVSCINSLSSGKIKGLWMSHKCLTFLEVFTLTTTTRLNIQPGEKSSLSKRFTFPCRWCSCKQFSNIWTNNQLERLQSCLKMESQDFRSKMPLIVTYVGLLVSLLYIYLKMVSGMWSSSERKLISCIRSLGWGKKRPFNVQ